ncbi:MAG: class I SAM-dependent methyltransferase [Candidatus Marinimicrobia bacterium]|nr:class I SAM-dependent methyltransferase [Candidatus Neomarinimicrobiota bacterium]
MMHDIIESVLMSLDGKNVELYPYIPYLLKDLWEIGSSADQMIRLLDRQNRVFSNPELKVLDLGCGKGAIAIPLAKKYGFTVKGIDAVPEFIEFAREKAIEWKVADRCQFEEGDIREYVEKCGLYDIIVLGSIGPVFGNVQETLRILSKCLRPNGIILLDDAYIPDGSDFYHNSCLPEAQFMTQIRRSGCKITDSIVCDASDMVNANEVIYKQTSKRAKELINIYPGLRYIFEDYLKTQRVENKILENNVTCALMLIELTHNHNENH